MNERLKTAFDRLSSDLFHLFCDPLAEADVVSHLYHLWYDTSATQIGWPHIDVWLPGLRANESVDFAVGSVFEAKGRRRLEPVIAVEVKVLLKDWPYQTVHRHIEEIHKRDLPKLPRIKSSRPLESYLLIADEWGFYAADRASGARAALADLVQFRERTAPGVRIVLFEKRDGSTVWSLH